MFPIVDAVGSEVCLDISVSNFAVVSQTYARKYDGTKEDANVVVVDGFQANPHDDPRRRVSYTTQHLHISMADGVAV